jgi:tetratricopeptide (TPR) repeat protein
MVGRAEALPMIRFQVTGLLTRLAPAELVVLPQTATRPKRALAGLLVLVLLLGGLATAALLTRLAGTGPSDDSALAHWRQAQAALAGRDWARARNHLSQCVAVSPLHAEAHFLLARTARRSGDLASWQLHLKHAEVLQWPQKELALEVVLGQAQSGDVRGAGPRLLPLLQSLHPERPLILEALVQGCLETNRHQEALHWANVWTVQFPDDWQPLLYRGHAFYLSRALGQAMADYRRVLELKPDQAEARLRLADAHLLEAQFEPALVQYQAYLQKHPEDPAALVSVANCQFSLGRLEASRATLKDLFARYQDQPRAPERHLAAGYFLQAKLALAEGSAPEALTWLRRAEALIPEERDIVYNLAVVLRQLGQPDEAGKYEAKLEEVRAQIQRLEELRKLLKHDPDNAALCHEAGMLSWRFGRHEEAGQWFKSALQLDPNHRPTHQALADFFEKSGDGPRAARHRERAQSR